MTAISTAAAEWLALRAPADDAARSTRLAHLLTGMLPPGPVVVHDLGAGTGSMTRWLAPRLPGPQRWVLRDGDAGILAHLDVAAALDRDGRPVAAEVSIERLAELGAGAFRGASAVTASALLDVLTRHEAGGIVAACVAARAPALFSLTVTGGVEFSRPDTDPWVERAIGAAFDDHQRRDTAGRRMLGPDAVPAVSALFARAGWAVRTVATPWRLRPRDAPLLVEWLDGWVDAAIEQRPALAHAAEEYRSRRRADAAAGALHVTVSHEDLLAWPS